MLLVYRDILPFECILYNISIPKWQNELIFNQILVQKLVYMTQRVQLTPIWGIMGTSGSVISGQKSRVSFFGFDDVIPDRFFLFYDDLKQRQ